jgi:hypothetical protein
MVSHSKRQDAGGNFLGPKSRHNRRRSQQTWPRTNAVLDSERVMVRGRPRSISQLSAGGEGKEAMPRTSGDN